MFVLTRNVPPHRVVARERTRAEGTWHADALVPLPDVGAQVGFVAI